MRKALLVFALVAFLATGTVFAEITGVGEPTVSGSVSLIAGYNLDEEVSGIDNDSSLTLTLPLLDGDMTKGGEDDMYGEITVDGIGWQLNNDGFYDVDEDADDVDTSELDASISAKLVLKDFFVDLGNPDFAMNYADVVDDDTNYPLDAHLYDDETDDWVSGFAVGFVNEMLEVTLKIGAMGSYETDSDDVDDDAADHTGLFDNDTDMDDDDGDLTINADNEYMFGADVTLNPAEGITVPISFVYKQDFVDQANDLPAATTDGDLIAFGMAPSFDFAPLTIDIPVDFISAGDTSGYEVMPKVAYCLTEAGGSNVWVQFLYADYTYDVLGTDIVTNAFGAVSVGFEETEEKGFVENLAATLDVELVDLFDVDDVDADIIWLVDGTASYNMDGLKPYAGAGYGDDEVLDLNLGVELGADFTGLDNTTITFDYAVDDLTDQDTTANNEKGIVTVDVTVSF